MLFLAAGGGTVAVSLVMGVFLFFLLLVLVDFSLALFLVQVDVLLFNELLELLDLCVVEVNAKFVGSCDEVGMDLLHLHVFVLVHIHLSLLHAFVAFALLLHHALAIVEGVLLIFVQVVFLVVNAALFVTVLFVRSHHALSLELLFAHLVKLVFFIVTVGDHAGNILSRYKLLVHLRILLVVVRAITSILVALKAHLLIHAPLLVDFLRSCDGIFKIDRYLVLCVVIVLLVRVTELSAAGVVVDLLLVLFEFNLNLIVVDHTLRCVMLVLLLVRLIA